MAHRLRGPGEFCWINMLTPDPTAARAFFSALLGWTYEEIPKMGHSILVDGRRVGGLFDLQGPMTPPGLPPAIGVMVRVESADDSARRAMELGGRARQAFEIGDQGRMAECWDPCGAQLDLWEGRKTPGSDADSTVHGAPSWFEVMTPDTAKASAFYQSLFGWTPITRPMDGFTYTSFWLGKTQVGGMMPILPSMGAVPPHWAVYFTVTDADAAAARAKELGGGVVVEPQDIPRVGRFAGIRSPQGVVFWVITYLARA